MTGPGRHWRKNGLAISMTPLKTTAQSLFQGRRRCWKLDLDFSMIIASHGMEQRVTVPKGYDTDYATIPIICQLVLGNRDDWAEAAVLHDWLCTTHVPRFICNAWMRSALFCLGAPRWKQLAFFYGLMLFGYGSPLSKGVQWLKKQCGTILAKRK
jgi:hypothetical protein